MKKSGLLTVGRLRMLLTYCGETGQFTRRVKRGSWAAGTSVGHLDGTGYVEIYVDGIRHKAHRLAWLYVHGQWPAAEVDHINGNRSDNRLKNLRAASRAQNARNTSMHNDNSTGLKGVSRNGVGWAASIMRSGRKVHLGTYRTAEDAHASYVQAAATLHGEFMRAA